MTDFTPSPVQRAFLDALALGESGGRYDVLYGGGTFSDYSHFPAWPGKEGPAGISHAAGRYQFEPATWRECAQRLGLTDFSPPSQDAAAWDLAAHVYKAKTGRDLASDLAGGDASSIALALHSTWSSLGASFEARYAAAFARDSGADPDHSADALNAAELASLSPAPPAPAPQPEATVTPQTAIAPVSAGSGMAIGGATAAVLAKPIMWLSGCIVAGHFVAIDESTALALGAVVMALLGARAHANLKGKQP